MDKYVLITFIGFLFLETNGIFKKQENHESGTKIVNARATSVYVPGNDVYVTGYQENRNGEKYTKL